MRSNLILLLALYLVANEACTTIILGKKATTDGSTMVTHNADCMNCDWRLSKVPAKDHAAGTMRPVWSGRLVYPRYVGTARGETYHEENLDRPKSFDWQNYEPIGHIPQVRHTFAYIEGTYGLVNEHQVGIGESTCGGKLLAVPVSDGGHALLEIGELTRIAMERATSAKEAVQIMGEMATKYGYYGAEWKDETSLPEVGEALGVVDPNEAWMFHIHPDDTGKSAVWVAQRLPEDHISVVANQFVIHEVDTSGNNPDFLFSDNILDVAQRAGFWHPSDGPFDFTNAYSRFQNTTWPYATRRQWRVLAAAAPSLKLSPITDPLADAYPTSVAVEWKWSVENVMDMKRDHFEGTPYDTTKGLASGPFGNPNRFDRSDEVNALIAGGKVAEFERPISMFRTVYSSVVQARDWVPNQLALLWVNQHAPHGGAYMPIYIGAESLPEALTSGSRTAFNKKSHFHVNLLVSNYAERAYSEIIPDVKIQQHKVYQHQLESQKHFEERAASLARDPHKHHELVHHLTKYVHVQARHVMDTWWELFWYLVTRFHDGYRIDDWHADQETPTSLFYPLPWLNTIGYFGVADHGGQIPASDEVGQDIGSGIASPFSGAAVPPPSSSGFSTTTMFVMSLVMVAMGIWIGRKYENSNKSSKHYYDTI